jgi:hypothetical protein
MATTRDLNRRSLNKLQRAENRDKKLRRRWKHAQERKAVRYGDKLSKR